MAEGALAADEMHVAPRSGSAEAIWDAFIQHLNATQSPIGKHKNLCGSIESYRKVFLDAAASKA